MTQGLTLSPNLTNDFATGAMNATAGRFQSPSQTELGPGDTAWTPLSFLKRLIVSANPSGRAHHRQARKAIVLCQALMSDRGEVSGAVHARAALAACDDLSEAGMALFFDLLVAEFSPDPQQVLRVADCYRDQPTRENLLELQRVVAPPRQELFHRLNIAPGGTTALVAIRRGVLRGLKSHPEWRVIDADLVQLFRSWFNPGFLKLERIDFGIHRLSSLNSSFTTKPSMKSPAGRISPAP